MPGAAKHVDVKGLEILPKRDFQASGDEESRTGYPEGSRDGLGSCRCLQSASTARLGRRRHRAIVNQEPIP